jgi:hypothetical protein
METVGGMYIVKIDLDIKTYGVKRVWHKGRAAL